MADENSIGISDDSSGGSWSDERIIYCARCFA